jgi:alanyl-tRNA synthetase
VTGHEIRRSFLAYFERHAHRIVPSASLVPHDDPTLLFTNAGMNQFKDLFLGRERRDYTRATTAQKCMRVSGKHNDLGNVGPSFRHHTFFEMLGNFSFGNYFKSEAITLAWTLLTEEWQLPKDRLFPTIFKGDNLAPRDDEAFEIWQRLVPAERMGELGAADNFWQMGDTGPCGRCSEIYFFRGTQISCAEEAGGGACKGVECSCDRYIEIWNNVFMEFDRQPNGTLKPLPARSIDTGMGLERVTAVIQGKLSNYDTDLFTPLLAAIAARTGHGHAGTMEPADVSTRVVADHMRAMTFLIADGVVPSNEKRGYVLRKIMRRAMRHGKRLGQTSPFLHTLVDTIVTEFGGAYPELTSGRDTAVRVVRAEEERFDSVLTEGLPRLEEVLDRAAAAGGAVPGDAAFKLYDTYGIPRDFIEDMIDERKLTFDADGFERAMSGQRDKARAKSSFKGGEAARAEWTAAPGTRQALERIGDKVFRGYEATSLSTTVVALFDETRQEADVLTAGAEGFVALAETPFYLEAGGQVSDVGTIKGGNGDADVTAVVRAGGWPRLHAVKVLGGRIAKDDTVTATVFGDERDATRRNHTATHLLHAALRQVLGPHVKQAGSLVAPERLRFDFAHFTPVTREQQLEIETIVNEQVLRNTPVTTDIKSTQEAIAGGAMALFGEKYGDTVRVVTIAGRSVRLSPSREASADRHSLGGGGQPDQPFSQELCGGTHVSATGDIGLFAIVMEGGVAAGVRRIEAITGLNALRAFQHNREELAGAAAALNARPDDLIVRVTALQDEARRLARELQQARMRVALGGSGASGQDAAVDVAGIRLVASEVSGLDKEGLRALVDRHRDRIKSGVVVIASPGDGKVAIVVGVTPDLVKTLPAGQIVKQLAPIVGGGGGGRPDFAEAGGKDASKIGEMLAAAKGVIEKMMTIGS